MVGANLLHLIQDLARYSVGIAGDEVAGANEAVRVELRKIESLPIALAKIIERSFRCQGRHQPLLVRGSLVDRLVEAAIEDGEKIAHRRLGDLSRLLVRLVDVDVAAENEIISGRFPTVIARALAIVIESVLDLVRSLVHLSGRQVALHAPFNGFRASGRNPYRRVRLLQRARPDGAVFKLKELSFVAPDRLGPRRHDEIVSLLEAPAGFFRV